MFSKENSWVINNQADQGDVRVNYKLEYSLWQALLHYINLWTSWFSKFPVAIACAFLLSTFCLSNSACPAWSQNYPVQSYHWNGFVTINRRLVEWLTHFMHCPKRNLNLDNGSHNAYQLWRHCASVWSFSKVHKRKQTQPTQNLIVTLNKIEQSSKNKIR